MVATQEQRVSYWERWYIAGYDTRPAGKFNRLGRYNSLQQFAAAQMQILSTRQMRLGVPTFLPWKQQPRSPAKLPYTGSVVSVSLSTHQCPIAFPNPGPAPYQVFPAYKQLYLDLPHQKVLDSKHTTNPLPSLMASRRRRGQHRPSNHAASVQLALHCGSVRCPPNSLPQRCMPGCRLRPPHSTSYTSSG